MTVKHKLKLKKKKLKQFASPENVIKLFCSTAFVRNPVETSAAVDLLICLHNRFFTVSFSLSGGPPDVGKMLGGEEKEEDPDAAKKEEERQEALRQQEEERKAKYAKMEAERESMRQGIRDKV